MIELRWAKSAERDLLDTSIGWRTHHPAAPDLFDDEISRALEQIMLFPDSAPRTWTSRYKNARIMVLQKTGCLLLYRKESKRRVRILAILAARTTKVRP
jgi:plasmid stabilization system protein ParE